MAILVPRIKREIPILTDWVSAGTVTITASTTNPTKGTVQQDEVWWRRVGDSMQVRMIYRQTTIGTAGSGDYRFLVPAGYEIDLTKVTANNTVQGSGFGSITSSKVGTWFGTNGATATLANNGNVFVVDSFHVGLEYTSHASASNGGGIVNSAALGLIANQGYRIEFTIPILDWTYST